MSAHFHTSIGRPEGYYHTALDPADEPNWCDQCGAYHDWREECAEPDYEEEDDGQPTEVQERADFDPDC